MKLILLGAPGAGKGTQAEVLSKALSIPTISTGNCLREAVAAGTEMGKDAASYMESGKLVPDEVVIGIIRERLQQDDCKAGFILDGFPRTVFQAEALEQMGIDIDKVIEIHVDDEKILKRLGGRRVCSSCGNSYHVEYKAPKVEGVCDSCGGKLVTRADDKEETIKQRLNVYYEQTAPLKEYYEKKGKLTVVEGQEEVSETSALTLKAVEA